jgi:hypothetical protein
LFPVWQQYCWSFLSAIVPVHTFTINAPFGSVLMMFCQSISQTFPIGCH